MEKDHQFKHEWIGDSVWFWLSYILYVTNPCFNHLPGNIDQIKAQ